MNADGLKDLFAPFGAVEVKPMFGAGIYAKGVCFAIEHGGEVFLKVDAAGLFGGRLFALHLQRQGQSDAHILLAASVDRSRRAE